MSVFISCTSSPALLPGEYTVALYMIYDICIPSGNSCSVFHLLNFTCVDFLTVFIITISRRQSVLKEIFMKNVISVFHVRPTCIHS